jgi:hypothetical protein
VCVQRSVQHCGHQDEQLLPVLDRTEEQTSTRRSDRGSWATFEAQALYEQPRTGALRYRHAVLDYVAGDDVLTPAGWDEQTELLGP